MDIFELLRKDHENALMLFDQLEQVSGTRRGQSAKQDRVFGQLRQELEVHMDGEEKLFYPRLRDDSDIRSMILEAYEEHHVAKVLIEELSGLPKDDKWLAKLSVLRENVEHHIDQEETEIFANAEEILDEDQREEMGKQMADLKKEVSGQG